MRKRLVLLLALVLASTALAMPTVTSATSLWGYRIVSNHCYGSGSIYFKVKLIKRVGLPNADAFQMIGKAMHKNGHNWTREYKYPIRETGVPYQTAKFGWAQVFDYTPSDSNKHRIIVKLWIRDGRAPVRQQTVKSVTC